MLPQDEHRETEQQWEIGDRVEGTAFPAPKLLMRGPNRLHRGIMSKRLIATALVPLAACGSVADASATPPSEPTAIVYAAEPATGRCSDRVLYYVRGTRVFAADGATGAPTTRILRYIDGDRVYDAQMYSGARTNLVLRYIIGDRVYAADVTGAPTNKILSYIVDNKVYSADMTGAPTNILLRCIVGTAKTD